MTGPTWIQTTHGGPATYIAETWQELDAKIEHAIRADARFIMVHVARTDGMRYRRTFAMNHIVQYGSTEPI